MSNRILYEQLMAEAKKKSAKKSSGNASNKRRKKVANSITYTTGDPDLNIARFNKSFGGSVGGYLNGTWKTVVDAEKAANKAAEEAAEAVTGTMAPISADGSFSLDTGDSGDGGDGGDGGGMGESLHLREAKREVRRYYIRPQNVFCANKKDVLKALIEFEDQNCSIYTLNNLGDEKDVTKLTNKDIIYYYDDGILYDKNHVRIMDYDLYIRHEEERKKFTVPIDQVSNAEFKKEYADRATDLTMADEDA